MSDVSIHAPAAVLGPDVDYASPEIRRLRAELEELKVTCSTIANITISLARMYRDTHGEDPVVPFQLHKQMEGAQISLAELPSGDVLVGHRERQPIAVHLEAV